MLSRCPIKAVIFDLDNTLVESDLDFGRIRQDIGFPTGPILEFRDNHATPEQREHINAVLERHEGAAAENCRLNEGAREALDAIRELGLKSALLTRNSAKTVETVLRRHGLRFDAVLSRDCAPPKPSPEPIFVICRRLAIQPENALMVGDYKYDVECGKNAGSPTVLLRTPLRDRFEAEPDWEIDSLAELADILRETASVP